MQLLARAARARRRPLHSVDEPEALACAQRVVEATGYHGQISFDFRRGRRGLEVIECNPRPTAGVHLMPDAVLVEAILGPPNGHLAVTPPGARRRYSAALVRDLAAYFDGVSWDGDPIP